MSEERNPFGFARYTAREDDQERFKLREKTGEWFYPPLEVSVTDNEYYLDPAYKSDLEKVIATIKKPEILGTEFPNHVALIGLPGTGKTVFAMYVATITGSDFVPISGFPSPEFVRVAFDETRKRAKEKHQIMFIDEVEKLGSREAVADDYKAEKLSMLLDEMGGQRSNYNITVMIAANKIEIADEALRRGGGRVGKEIEFFSLSPEGRYHVLRILAYNLSHKVLAEKNPAKKGHQFRVDESLLQDLAKITHGYTNGDLKEVLKESFLNAYIDGERLEVKIGDIQTAMKQIRPSALKDLPLKTPRKSFKDLVGLEGHIAMITDYIGEKYTHESPGKTLMFYGGAGLGKSALAEAIAHHYGINFLEVSGAELLDGLVGKTNKDIDRIITRAEQHRPTLLLFDEFQALFKTRGYQSFKDTWTGQFQSRLNYLPGGVIIIATLSHPSLLEDQTVERFEKLVPFYPPTIENLTSAWQHYLAPFNGEFNYQALGNASEGIHYRAVERIARSLQTQKGIKPTQEAILDLIKHEKKLEDTSPRDDLTPYLILADKR